MAGALVNDAIKDYFLGDKLDGPHVTEAEEFFKKIDRDGNGKISRKELQQASFIRTSAGVKYVTPEEKKKYEGKHLLINNTDKSQLFDEIDVDGDDEIDRTEFIKWMTELTNWQYRRRRWYGFSWLILFVILACRMTGLLSTSQCRGMVKNLRNVSKAYSDLESIEYFYTMKDPDTYQSILTDKRCLQRFEQWRFQLSFPERELESVVLEGSLSDAFAFVIVLGAQLVLALLIIILSIRCWRCIGSPVKSISRVVKDMGQTGELCSSWISSLQHYCTELCNCYLILLLIVAGISPNVLECVSDTMSFNADVRSARARLLQKMMNAPFEQWSWQTMEAAQQCANKINGLTTFKASQSLGATVVVPGGFSLPFASLPLSSSDLAHGLVKLSSSYLSRLALWLPGKENALLVVGIIALPGLLHLREKIEEGKLAKDKSS